MSDLLVQEQQPIQLHNDNPIAVMLQGIIDKGITTETASAMEKLTDLYLKVESENARKAFAVAFSALQADMPRIVATKAIPNNDGTVRSTFAPLEEIIDAINPYLAKHGFSIGFDSTMDMAGKGSITAICNLRHLSGHSEQGRFTVILSAPPKASEAQACGATVTYAKRYALCNMLNIQISKDDDARALGDYIKPEQAASLARRVSATGSDEAKFLRLAGAETFAEIRSGKYTMLDTLLMKKEAAPNTPQKPQDAAPATKPAEKPVEQPKAATPQDAWAAFYAKAELLAQQAGIDPDRFDKGMKDSIVGTGKKGKEHQITEETRQRILTAILDKSGHFSAE